MKTKCNKLIALLLSLTMLMGVVMSTPMTAFAASISKITLNYEGSIDALPGGLKTLFIDDEGFEFNMEDSDQHDGYQVVSVEKNKVVVTPNNGTISKFSFGIVDIAGTVFTAKCKGTTIRPTGGLAPVTGNDTANYYLYTWSARGYSGEVTIDVTSEAAPKTVSLARDDNSFTISDVKVNDVSAEPKSKSNTAFDYSVPENGSLSFQCTSVVLGQNVQVKWNKQVVPLLEEKYTISGVTTDGLVSIQLVPATYTITYTGQTSGGGFTTNIQSGDRITHGNPYDFIVTPEPGYGTPTVTYTMTGTEHQDKKLDPTSGNNYRIPSVTNDVTITIEPSAKEKRKLTFHVPTGVTFTKENDYGELTGDGDTKTVNVEYKNDYKFKVNLGEQYDKSSITVRANGKVVPKGVDNVYTISGITDDMDITVDGVTTNTYTVSFEDGMITERYTVTPVTPSNVVSHGGSYSFRIAVAPGYPAGSMQVSATGSDTLSPDGSTGVYTIDSITQDVTVTISGLDAKEKYTVTKPETSTAHAKIEFIGGDGQSVEYNSPVRFKVSSNDGYKVRGVSYSMGGNSYGLQANGEGQYTIQHVTAACSIHVEVEKVKVTVRYHNTDPNVSSSYKEQTYMIADDGDTTVPLDQKPTATFHKFVRWANEEGGENPASISFGTTDVTEDVYGVWELNYASLFTVKLNAVKGPEGGETTRLDLIIDWRQFSAPADTLATQNNLSIASAGILYSDESFSLEDPEAVKTAIQALQGSGKKWEKGNLTGGGTIGVYYYNYANPDGRDHEHDSTKTIRFRVKKDQDRYAIGWVVVTDDSGNRVVVLTDGDVQHVFGQGA